jgi:hypothetical protein
MPTNDSHEHLCPRCDSVMYFAAGQYRCNGRCGFHTACSDVRLWKSIVNLQLMLRSVEGMLSLLPSLEVKREGPPTDFYAEVLRETEFRRATLDEK